jgi:hypothetical protein
MSDIDIYNEILNTFKNIGHKLGKITDPQILTILQEEGYNSRLECGNGIVMKVSIKISKGIKSIRGKRHD